jgi:hypothetical protein
MSITQNAVGAAFGTVETSPTFELGTMMNGPNGSKFIYAQAGAAITGAGYVCVIDEDGEASMILTASGSARGDRVGVAPAVMAEDDYGWFQVYGAADVRTAVADANAVMRSTATAGQIDDAATGKEIERLFLTEARAGSAGLAAAMLNFPTIGATAT